MELEALRQQIDRAFTDGGYGAFPKWRMAFLPGRAARQYPLVNVYDDGTDLYVEALAPGIEPDKFEITIVGDRLTIAGEKPGIPNVAPEKVHRTERAAGRFMRTVELPAEVDADKVATVYRNGLLMLTLPRAESARPRRIEVHAN
jgi:HSP20 family protein